MEKFIQLLEKTDIAELIWEKNGIKIGFKKEEEKEEFIPSKKETKEEIKKETKKETFAKNGLLEKTFPGEEYVIIKSPMVGTFHRVSTPDKPPLVEEGTDIQVGQKICVIEAMKIFKEITSEMSGRIVKILVENGHAVEYGQSLFLVDPQKTTLG